MADVAHRIVFKDLQDMIKTLLNESSGHVEEPGRVLVW